MHWLRYILALVVVAVLAVAVLYVWPRGEGGVVTPPPPTPPSGTTTPRVEVVAEGLEIPWDIRFLSGGDMLVSERPGRIVRIAKDGTKTPISYESDVRHRGEGGLLGLTLHPDFTKNDFVYLYVSTPVGTQTENRVERYRLDSNALVERKIILDGIPGATYHDGGRMEFGPDGYLYVTTGDATKPALAQDKNSLGGKILRLKDDGSPAPGNPFGDEIYSYGHRNPQGLAWDTAGRLWETEHGPTGENGGQCCHDEMNLLKAGGNYGWPTTIGDAEKSGMTMPALHSSTDTWAPASLAYLNGKLFFGGLRGEGLYEVTINGDNVTNLTEHFNGEFGRIRTVRVGPDGMLYLTTSNRDGRGTVHSGDDKILRVDPKQL